MYRTAPIAWLLELVFIFERVLKFDTGDPRATANHVRELYHVTIRSQH